MDEDLRAGIRDALPLHLGVVPFALVAGIAAIDAGLTPAEAVGMSAVVFAGASQLAALELIGDSAPLVVVVGTAVVINLRMLMYSASIAPHFAGYRRRLRAVLAYLLTDQAYALSIAEYRDESVDREAWKYYVGIAGSLWAVWMVGTVAGVGLGASIPESWGLSFAVPLVFVAILVPAMKGRSQTVAAVVGGGVALLAATLPLNLGLLAGALAGILAGALFEVTR